jgi:hypothetical protein
MDWVAFTQLKLYFSFQYRQFCPEPFMKASIALVLVYEKVLPTINFPFVLGWQAFITTHPLFISVIAIN